MRKFYRNVDRRSRKAMTDFLTGHFRYSTMNSWNGASSYAHNMKLHSLMLGSETVDKLYVMIQCAEFYDAIGDHILNFGAEHGWLWQAGFNGRSDGYLVLYQGEKKPSGYKSWCPSCGQQNAKRVAEGSNKCGVCGKARRNYTTPHMRINKLGRGTDEREDFSDWEMCQLRDRVELVQSFDKLADAIVAEAVYLAKKYDVEEEKFTVTKTRQVLVEKAVAA